jgi:hypothetical protein
MSEGTTGTAKAYALGLDLGQAQDPSALCVVEQRAVAPSVAEYHCRYLHRWPLGTEYHRIVTDVRELVTRPPLRCPLLALDATGVGAPITEMVVRSGVAATVCPILITGGHQVTREGMTWHVPKADLVGVVQKLLQARHLKVAAELPLAGALLAELKNLKATITTAGHTTYEAWRSRDHDDLVLALALSTWILKKFYPSGCCGIIGLPPKGKGTLVPLPWRR